LLYEYNLDCGASLAPGVRRTFNFSILLLVVALLVSTAALAQQNRPVTGRVVSATGKAWLALPFGSKAQMWVQVRIRQGAFTLTVRSCSYPADKLCGYDAQELTLSQIKLM
jgi:hypothetical protein